MEQVKCAMSIDILTFNKPQMLLIQDMLKKLGLLQGGRVDVMTVDSMQGREADIVLCSKWPMPNH